MSARGGLPGEGAEAGARERVLGRIRDALLRREPVEHPGPLPDGAGPALAGSGDVATAFALAFERSGGEAVLFPDGGRAREWLDRFASGFTGMAPGADVPPHLRPSLPEMDPSSAPLGVSVAVAAAAATGSLVLASRGGRAPQLLPPVHLVWVEAGAIAPDLPSALAAAAGRGLPAVLALHSGPSKSSDIGRIVVTGVHGPGRVVAAVVGVEIPSG